MARMKQTGRGASGGGSIRQKTLKRAGKTYTYWEARYTAGDNPNTGRQIQRTITGKTKTEGAQKLRQKLGESGNCIETVRGIGYKIAGA